MTDENKEIRMKALEYILKAREYWSKKANDSRCKFKFRKFVSMSGLGLLNLEAGHYFDLPNWPKILKQPHLYGVPPLLADYTNDELKQFAENGTLYLEPNMKIPCHSQSVERLVGLTSRAAKQVIGREKIHSYILNLERTSNELPISGGYVTKSQFSCFSKQPPAKKRKKSE